MIYVRKLSPINHLNALRSFSIAQLTFCILYFVFNVTSRISFKISINIIGLHYLRLLPFHTPGVPNYEYALRFTLFNYSPWRAISENQLNTVGKKPLIVEVTAAIGSTNS